MKQGDLRTHVSVVLPLEFGVGLDLPGARPLLLLNALTSRQFWRTTHLAQVLLTSKVSAGWYQKARLGEGSTEACLLNPWDDRSPFEDSSIQPVWSVWF